MSIGIIGYGRFGQLMAKHVSRHFQVLVFDPKLAKRKRLVPRVSAVSMPELLQQARWIVVGIPAQNLEAFWKRWGKSFGPQHVVIDVCSVKLLPVQLMKRYVKKAGVLIAAHPLFGPHSARDSIQGLPLVLSKVRGSSAQYEKLKQFIRQKLHLKVLELEPAQHDRQMAYVQALTFFMGRALNRMKIPDTPLATATYRHLLEINRIVGSDTPALFHTIQTANPFAASIRKKLLQVLKKIDQDLRSKQ
jgi:prephenate dehydrogenase